MPVSFHNRTREEPEINLVPFIDVLLVVLIFLMVSTTFTKLSEMQVTLPTATPQPLSQRPKEIVVAVTAEGRYLVDRRPLEGRSVEMLAAELSRSAAGDRQATIVISADAAAVHQSVINVMDAARRAGLVKLAFATRAGQDDAASGAAQP